MEFIQLNFNHSGKGINKELVAEMVRLTNNQPDYLQQLCHNVWIATESEATLESIETAMDLVVRSNALHHQDICEALINTQLNLVLAILEDETKLTASETMQKYNLGTPRNVSKNKRVLEEKDIEEFHGESIGFNDPIFEYTLRKK